MADIFTKKQRSEIMSKVRGKETKMEIHIRKALWKKGFRYRKNVSGYFGKPDILLKKFKTVIFLDSCFWHGCIKHGSLPKTRAKFWKEKIERNKERDREVSRYYKKEGWNVLRIWEHEIKKDMEIPIKKIVNFLNSSK